MKARSEWSEGCRRARTVIFLFYVHHKTANQDIKLIFNFSVFTYLTKNLIQTLLFIFTQEAPLTRKWFSGRSCIRSNWNLELLIFEKRGKPENPEKNLSEQSIESTTNLTHSWPETGPRRWEASAITTSPSLLPKFCFHVFCQRWDHIFFVLFP